ncbi:MAG: group III truncated hemoglobin [Flavobacteriales bacterium]
MNRKDIADKEDIALMVETFYAKVFADPLLAVFFQDLDFESHKPRMIHFWSFVLLDEPGYTTNVFDKHAHMPLKKEHFTRWVEIFCHNVDEHFSGPKAEDAKLRARTIGFTFASKMDAMR